MWRDTAPVSVPPDWLSTLSPMSQSAPLGALLSSSPPTVTSPHSHSDHSHLHSHQPSAALLAFIAHLPRYPLHLYARSESSANASQRLPLPLPLPTYTTQSATLLLSSRRSHSSEEKRETARTTPSQRGQHQQRAAYDSSLIPRVVVQCGELFIHRPLVGRLEQYEVRERTYALRQLRCEAGDANNRRPSVAALSPLDFLITQQTQRRQAAAHRRQHMEWRERIERGEVATTGQHHRIQQSAVGVLARSIAGHERSDDRAVRRRSGERRERQAAQQFAQRRQQRQQAEKEAAAQWDAQTDGSEQRQQQRDMPEVSTQAGRDEQTDEDEQAELEHLETDDSETTQYHAERAGGSEECDRQQVPMTAESDTTPASGAVQKDDATAATRPAQVQAIRPRSQQLQQRQPLGLLPTTRPPSSSPPLPLLSIAFLLSCLPPSCDAMEWTALCLSYLPLKAEQLQRLANFLSAAHSLMHITSSSSNSSNTAQTTLSTHSHADWDSHSQPAGSLPLTDDTRSLAWLSGLMALPACVFQPLHDSLTQSPQQPHSASVPASCVESANGTGESECDSSACSVHSRLLRHWARLCEWRWCRPQGPTVDQLLHLLHIVAHKVEVDVESHSGAGTVDFRTVTSARGSEYRDGPARRLVALLNGSLGDSRGRLTRPTSPSHSHASSSRLTVSVGLFVVTFSCLFGLSSFPHYRSTDAVCASIDRVFVAVLPVSVEESAKQQRLRQQVAARTAEVERRAAILRARALETLQAERRAMQRLEERRAREAAILALHQRAEEWSAAAMNGVFVRPLPPHPLPPLQLT